MEEEEEEEDEDEEEEEDEDEEEDEETSPVVEILGEHLVGAQHGRRTLDGKAKQVKEDNADPW